MLLSVSIIICTRNRATSLRWALESIGHTTVPSGWEVELIVVDNGSTDSTEATVAAITLPNMPVRYFREPHMGQSHARNAGIASAHGSIILFTDDDVRVPPNWVEGMCGPILADRADAVAGGVVFPPRIAYALSKEPFSTRRGWYASTEYLDPDHPAAMIGANMAFHRRVLERVHGFAPELGPGALGFEDETLFSKQIVLAGCRLIGAFEVAVEHHFDPRRICGDGLLDIARKKGRSNAFVFHHWQHQRSRMAGPRLLWFCTMRTLIRLCSRLVGQAAAVPTGPTLHVEEELAFCREYLIQRQRPRKYSRRGLAPLAEDSLR
jgi:glucosyl-dolichyl phosphate glucuronosyltransferase